MKINPIDMSHVFRAYDALSFDAKAYLGYAYRQRGAVGARILVEKCGHQPELQAFFALMLSLELPLPEGCGGGK